MSVACAPARRFIPDGYREELLQSPRIDERGRTIVAINDEELFWQKPPGE